MSALKIIQKIDQKLSFILSSIMQKNIEDITDEDLDNMKETNELLSQQLSSEQEILEAETEELIEESEDTILNNLLLTIASIVGCETEEQKERLELEIDEDDIEVLLKFENDIENLIKNEFGDFLKEPMFKIIKELTDDER